MASSVNSTSIRCAPKPSGQPVEQELGDLHDLVLGQGAEDDDLVDPVDELRPEALAEDLHQVVLQLVEGFLLAGVLADPVGTEVEGAGSRCSSALPSQAVEVRRATDADQQAMQALWEASIRETAYTPYPAAPFSPALLTEHLGLLAEDGREPVGCIYVNTGNDGFGFVFGLYVRLEMRRRGYARLLMRSVAEELQSAGKGYIVLSVDTPNTAGRALYEDLGFIDAARTLRVEVNRLLEGHS